MIPLAFRRLNSNQHLSFKTGINVPDTRYDEVDKNANLKRLQSVLKQFNLIALICMRMLTCRVAGLFAG